MRAHVSTVSGGATATTRGWWRRHRGTLLLVAGLLAALGVAALSSGPASSSASLDPDNPGASGARATARVLQAQGVEVTVARDAGALEDLPVGADTTVVVTSAELLGRSTADRLLDHVGRGSLVVVDPGAGATEALGVDSLPMTTLPTAPVPAGCDDPALQGLELAVDRGLGYETPGCFGTAEGRLVARPRPGLTLLGAGEALSNDQVLRADNAAAVLRLLGQRPRLVWYVPDAADLVGDDGVSLQTLLPPWLRPALLLGVLGAVSLVLWRARRLGPLAVEPLPVEVSALETTRSRGRLYRRAGDRGHAAASLRRASRQRLAGLLAVPASDEDAVAARVAALVARPAPEVSALLGPGAPAPTTDRGLITLASALAALEEEAGRP